MKNNWLILCFLTLLTFTSCEKDYTPRPHAYMRIDLPEHHYLPAQIGNCPFEFQMPLQSLLIAKDTACWFNLEFPKFNATLHISYADLHEDFAKRSEDARNLAMKHIVKANDINEVFFRNDSAKVYGMIYDFEGSTASTYQFFLTDSTQHFFRGSLYFNVIPNPDSIAPVAAFIKEDLRHMLSTFRWK